MKIFNDRKELILEYIFLLADFDFYLEDSDNRWCLLEQIIAEVIESVVVPVSVGGESLDFT